MSERILKVLFKVIYKKIIVIFLSIAFVTNLYGYDDLKEDFNTCFKLKRQNYLDGHLVLSSMLKSNKFHLKKIGKEEFAHQLSLINGIESPMLADHYYNRKVRVNDSFAYIFVTFAPNKGFDIEEKILILNSQNRLTNFFTAQISIDPNCKEKKSILSHSIVQYMGKDISDYINH